jgi:phytoene desaturase
MDLQRSDKKQAIVLGAGVAGLAASIRLSALGYRVLLLEKNGFCGGKLSEIQLGAYRFDAGPSLFTMPHLVEELYWISGDKADSFSYKKLDEVCRYFFKNGLRFVLPANEEQRIRTLQEALGEDPEKLHSYMETSRFRYETIGRLFLERCLRKPGTFFNRLALKAYINLHRLGLFSTLNSLNQKAFRNPLTRQLFNRYATYNGSDPYQTPAVMSMIPHLEFGIGAFFPGGGMVRITESLEALARKNGVEIRMHAAASRLKAAGSKVEGVFCGEEFIPCDLLISALDVGLTYTLLPGKKATKGTYARHARSTSAIIWYWGIHRSCPETGLHNLFFSNDYQAEFQALFHEKTMPAEPSIYLNISCKEHAADAPPDCENWFVMVNAPANEAQDWDRLISESRKVVIERLSMELGFDVEKHIEEETCLDPRSLESRTGALGGALYGSNSNHRFAAFLRHPNFSREYQNLFFCGGTVHPGGGIPLALQSARLAVQYVEEEFGRPLDA